MAPEVVLCQPYNLSADVYSYGILLWQILSLTTPFQGFTLVTHQKRVVLGGERPDLDPNLPVQIRTLIDECWSSTIMDRPKFGEVCAVLKGYLTGKMQEMNGMGGGGGGR